jgi:uncharacterized SAM-binding protein YcdF (DUF218 family)
MIAAILLLLASGWIGVHAGTALVVSREVGAPDAIVMLASHEFERLPATVALARRYPASLVLHTVPTAPNRWNCQMCDERAVLLQSAGIARERIVELPDRALNTYGEAVATRQYLSAHPLRRLMIVTSPYHTRRALGTFRHVLVGTGTEVGVQPSGLYSPANPQSTIANTCRMNGRGSWFTVSSMAFRSCRIGKSSADGRQKKEASATPPQTGPG